MDCIRIIAMVNYTNSRKIRKLVVSQSPATPMSESKIVRVQDKGQVTLPAELRRRLGLKKGDLIAFVETEAGYLLSPKVAVAMKALDQMGDALREKGVSLDEWIESGRQVRGRLLKKHYGIDPAQQGK
jgi:AbrB family looped-hinge helix DNA binding protein